jgi:hypothetical protein
VTTKEHPADGDDRAEVKANKDQGPSTTKSPDLQESAPDPIVERRYGALVVIGYRDARTAKVAIVRCDCGNIVERSVATLTAGDISNCGNCRAAPAKPADRSDSFASNVAGMESWGAREKHFGGGGGS